MANAWIKMDCDLPTKDEVFLIAKETGLNRFEVCGRLLVFWSWIDRLAVDGVVANVDASVVDEIIGVDGFSQALVDAKWLVVTSTGIKIPKVNRHLERSAKSRSLKSERQARWREKKKEESRRSVDDVDASQKTSTVDDDASTREEKRREDIYNKPHKTTSSQSARATLEEIELFVAAEFSLNKSFASQCFTKLQAADWKDGKGSPVQDWQKYIRGKVNSMSVIERDQFTAKAKAPKVDNSMVHR